MGLLRPLLLALALPLTAAVSCSEGYVNLKHAKCRYCSSGWGVAPTLSLHRQAVGAPPGVAHVIPLTSIIAATSPSFLYALCASIYQDHHYVALSCSTPPERGSGIHSSHLCKLYGTHSDKSSLCTPHSVVGGGSYLDRLLAYVKSMRDA